MAVEALNNYFGMPIHIIPQKETTPLSLAAFQQEAVNKRYRSLGMWLSCICQVWEQQVIKFVKDEIERDGLLKFEREVDFNEAKDCFRLHNYDIESIEYWPKIKELRLLVNVIKHAEGSSADRLRRIRPDFFQWDEPDNFGDDRLSFHQSSLLAETLKITNEDFIDYYDALINFWDELPERMFSNELSP